MVAVTSTADGTQEIEALYRLDGDRLWRALLAYSGNPEIASDAVAEAFAQALRRGAAISNPQNWVWRAGFRIAAGELKKRGTTEPSFPDVGYLDDRTDTDLLDALAQLPAKQRAAVILFYYADASVREVAQRTSSSPLAVRANLSRGRKRLKQILGERDD
jgi:RNA polymerase sigma-70 factor, ECF subfamily